VLLLESKAMKNPFVESNSSGESSPLKRRGVLAGAGAVGAAALAVKLLPSASGGAAAASVAALPKVVDTDGGYRLSEHVKRYYETARS
jgi:hypothetical protein